MVATRHSLVFPEESLFFRLDGVCFVLLPSGIAYAQDDQGQLLLLIPSYAAEIARMLDHAEVLTEMEFRADLAEDASLPEPVEGR